jgi:hypothetical protein
MSLAQLKSGELLDLLVPSLLNGESLLSEFEIHRIIREARKIPERYQGLSIEGLALLVSGEIDAGCALCEQGLLLVPNDSVALCNYTLALRQKGLHVKQYEILKSMVNSFNPGILSEVAMTSAFWTDIDVLQKVLPVLGAMDIVIDENLEKCAFSLHNLQESERNAHDFRLIGQIMMRISQKHRLRVTGSHTICEAPELSALFVEVKTDDPDLLSKVNDELADEILAAGLENSECVGYFQAGAY